MVVRESGAAHDADEPQWLRLGSGPWGIAPANFIYSWFDNRATIYQYPNDHFAYNLGFVIAIFVIYGGSGRFSRRV